VPRGGHSGCVKLAALFCLVGIVKIQVTIVAYTMNLAQRNKKLQKIYQKTIALLNSVLPAKYVLPNWRGHNTVGHLGPKRVSANDHPARGVF